MVVKAPHIKFTLPCNLTPDTTVKLLQLFLLSLIGLIDLFLRILLLVECLEKNFLIMSVAVKVEEVALVKVFQRKFLKLDLVHDANSFCPVQSVKPLP